MRPLVSSLSVSDVVLIICGGPIISILLQTLRPQALDGWMDGGRSGLTQLAVPLSAAAAVLTDNSTE